MRLNFGCGSIQPTGWCNLDTGPEFNAQYRSTRQLHSESFDVVVAHCALQVNTHQDLPFVLKDLRRILKPGGVLRLSLPDVEEGFRRLTQGDVEWFPNGEDDIHDRFSNWLTWYSTARVVLTAPGVQNLLREAGFGHSTISAFGVGPHSELDTREGECFFVEATK